MLPTQIFDNCIIKSKSKNIDIKLSFLSRIHPNVYHFWLFERKASRSNLQGVFLLGRRFHYFFVLQSFTVHILNVHARTEPYGCMYVQYKATVRRNSEISPRVGILLANSIDLLFFQKAKNDKHGDEFLTKMII